MHSFSLDSEIQKIVEENRLVAIRLRTAPDEFKAAYILNANDNVTITVDISPSGDFDGINIYDSYEISSFGFDTEYIDALRKKVDPSIVSKAKQSIKNIKEFSFAGFAKAFAQTDTLVEVEYDTDFRPIGRITACDEKGICLEEVSAEADEPLATFLIKYTAIIRMSIDIPYMTEKPTVIRKVLHFFRKN